MCIRDRLMRIREKLIPYNFPISWIEGKKNVVADALSRYPVFPAEEAEDIHTVSPVSFHVTMSDENKDIPLTIDTMATAANQEYINLRDAVLNSDENIPDSPFVQSYKRVWDRLSVSNENNNLVLLDGSRIIVPQNAIKAIVKLLHHGHPGITKAQKLAAQLYYWPGMNNDIAQVVNNCESCQQLRPTQPNMTSVPNLPSSHANFPMQAVGTDRSIQFPRQRLPGPCRQMLRLLMHR